MKKQFGTLPLWAAVLIIGTVVAVSVALVNWADKAQTA
jgi:hypothetical protein